MERNLKVVVIGGGTGQSTILRGLKQIENVKKRMVNVFISKI